jgi:hypothetical protein
VQIRQCAILQYSITPLARIRGQLVRRSPSFVLSTAQVGLASEGRSTTGTRAKSEGRRRGREWRPTGLFWAWCVDPVRCANIAILDCTNRLAQGQHLGRSPGASRSAFVFVFVLEGCCLQKRRVNPIRSASPELHPRSGLKVLVRRFVLVLVVVLESWRAE